MTRMGIFILVIMIVAFIVVFWFLLSDYAQAPEVTKASPSASASASPVPSVGSEIFGQTTPVPSVIPKTNPFKGSLNPFSDAYQNPFK